MDEAALIIGGGVGPMAGVALHGHIVRNTLAAGDEDHLDLCHLSLSRAIPDRTEFLLGRTAVNPAAGMADALGMALRGFAPRRAVVGVPCNTFHAAPIFDVFKELAAAKAAALGSALSVVDMIAETAAALREGFPAARAVGLMTTTGTRRVGLYERALADSGARVIQVPEDRQELLHACIYDRSWGLKACYPASERALTELFTMARLLADEGAEVLIMGCTELPLALTESPVYGMPLLDPVEALARAMLREAAPAKLAPRA